MIEVKLSREVSSEIRVTYRLDPPTSEDYSHSPQPLVFAPGETAKTIEVDTTQDMLAEDEEIFAVELLLSSTTAGVSLGRDEATVTITDDALRATIEGDASVDEGEAAVYTVTVTGGTFGTGEDDQVTVTWSTEGSSATPNEDFRPASDTLVLRRGGAVGDVHDSAPKTTTSRNSARIIVGEPDGADRRRRRNRSGANRSTSENHDRRQRR